MPSLNQIDFIEIAARSALGQRNVSLELIIADGGSTDGTLGVLEKLVMEFAPRIRWASVRDAGPASAINKALQLSRADIIGWLNADDIYAPDSISLAVRTFTTNANLIMLYGEAEHVDAKGNLLRRYPTLPPSAGVEAFQFGCFICQPTVFLRRSVFDDIGGLDEGLSTAFDFDLWLRVFSRFPERIGYTDRVLAFSRLHGYTITATQRKNVASEAVCLLFRHLGKADYHWVLTYIDEAARSYPSYDPLLAFRDHVSAMVAEIASCFDRRSLSRLCSLIDQDRRLASVSRGVHADMFPDGWAKGDLSVRIRAPACGSLLLILRCQHRRPDDTPLKLRIFTSEATETFLNIAVRGDFEIRHTFANVALGQFLFVLVQSDVTFIPSEAEQGSTDARELAYLVTQILLVEH